MLRTENIRTPAVTLPGDWTPEAVEEVALLLAAGQLKSLECAARRRGLCMAQLLRLLIGEFLRREVGAARPL
jgi:hypothetical protein